MKKIKNILFSENGMRIVNGLFLLSAIFARRSFIFIAYIVWIIYLLYCIKINRSKASRIIYGVMIGLASVIIIVNVYFMMTGWRALN